MDWFWRELKQALRGMQRNPGFATVVVATLGLGIGGNAAILSVVHATFFSPLPFPESAQILRLQASYRKPDGSTSLVTIRGRDFNVLEQVTGAEAGPFAGLVGLEDVNVTMTGRDFPEQVTLIHCTPGWMAALGVRPVAGRWFSAEEERRGDQSSVAVISHELWQRRFGGDARALGGTIALDGRAYAIVGVMPAGFRFPYDAEMWIPVTTPWDFSRDYAVFARLKPGVSRQSAQSALDAAAGAVRQQFPDTVAGFGFAQSLLVDNLLDNQQGAALALAGVAAFFLLLACLNVANLLLVRSVARQREQAIRAALGASRGQLVRGQMVETAVLAAAGTCAGWLLSTWLSGWLDLLVPSNITRQLGIVPQSTAAPVILGTAAIGLLVGIFSGLLPALRGGKADAQALIHESGRTGRGRWESRIMDSFAVVQFMLALALLAGAGLMMRNFGRLTHLDLGIDASHLLSMQVSVTAPRFDSAASKRALIRDIVREVESAPGVVAAGVTSLNPLGDASWWVPVVAEGRDETPESATPLVNHRLITPDLCRAMGVSLLRGRYFTEGDDENAPPVVLVSERMARKFWPDADPIGKRVRVNRPGQPWLTVVGVAGNVLDTRDPTFPKETWYLPYAQFAASPAAASVSLMVRSAGDPRSVEGAVEKAVHRVAPDVAVFGQSTMDVFYLQSLARDRLSVGLIAALAGFGLLLGALGIYGTLSFTVGERVREIGIRMALGATPREILTLLLGHGLRISLAAAVLGLGAAWAMGRVLASQLTQVSPADPFVLVSAAGALLVVAAMAIYIPARRAASVDPMVALRQE